MKKLNYQPREFLEMHWLRPETAAWNCIAAKHIGEFLLNKTNILELGIGNGTFTFMAMGGKFSIDFDWYLNTNIEGFLDNKDIYDCDAHLDPTHAILRRPQHRIKCALDHKENLLVQALRLGFIDKGEVADGNKSFQYEGIDNIFSNMIYWLNDLAHPLKEFDKMLPTGGQALVVMPNDRYEGYCKSYNDPDPIWQRLNRGRKDSVLWRMSLSDFKQIVVRETSMKVVHCQSYLSDRLLNIWDVGLRMLSPALIQMSQALTRENRAEIKKLWCDLLEPFMHDLIEYEDHNAHRNGGYNLIILEKK